MSPVPKRSAKSTWPAHAASVESDPFTSQVRVTGDVAMLLAVHDTLSFGENLGALDCHVPVERFHWLPTRQPVVWTCGTTPTTLMFGNTITPLAQQGQEHSIRATHITGQRTASSRSFNS